MILRFRAGINEPHSSNIGGVTLGITLLFPGAFRNPALHRGCILFLSAGINQHKAGHQGI